MQYVQYMQFIPLFTRPFYRSAPDLTPIFVGRWTIMNCRCLITLLLITYAQSQTFNISVRDAGVDGQNCIQGAVPCRTLDYVLLVLSNTTCNSTDTTTAYVHVGSSQSILPAKYNFYCPLMLFISGTGGAPPAGTALNCLTRDRLELSASAQSSVSVYWKDVCFVNCVGPDSNGLSQLSFNRCQAVNGGGAQIVGTANVEILSSSYSFGLNALGADSFLLISHSQLAHVYITDTTFTTTSIKLSESATALWIVNSTIHIQGQVTFANNTGVLGGAVRLTRSQIIANGNVSVLFFKNFAQFGSAVFIEEIICPIFDASGGHVFFSFQKNVISGAGQSQVYIDAPQQLSACFPDPSGYNVSFDDTQHQMSTSAVKMSVDLPPGFSVIPGKSIFLNINITDYFQYPVACAAIVYTVQTVDGVPVQAFCNDPRHGVELICPFASPQQPSSEVLISSNFFNSTLSLKSSVQPFSSTNVSLEFACNNNVTATVSLMVSDCPSFTMYFSNSTKSCECKIPRLLQSQFVCSVDTGAACIRRGYWLTFENTTSPLVAPCGFPFCKGYSSYPCPLIMTGNPDFVKLGDNPDDQCLGNRGGLLCGGCGTGYYPTYPPIRCVETCSVGYSVALLFIAISIQIVKAVLIYAIFNLKIGKDSGGENHAAEHELEPQNFTYFFGSLFCLSVLGRLPFQYLPQFQGLNICISIYRSLVLPALDVVADIPWCLFPSIGTLGVFSFNFLAPLLAYTIFAIFYAVKRLCAWKGLSSQPAGLRSLSLLVALSFWSLSYTSISILKGTHINGLDGIRVEIEPEVTYFTRGHIPLAIVSIIIMAILLSFTVLLLLLPLLYCEKMKKLKNLTGPVVEHFQFCFKKGTTWYGAVYFLVWMVMAAVSEYQEYLLAFEILLGIFCALHFVIQPFKSLSANRIDMGILLDLLVSTSLLRYQISLQTESLAITVIVHLLVVALMIYMTFGLLILIVRQCNCASYVKNKYSKLKETRRSGGSNLKHIHNHEDEEGYNIFGGTQTGKQAAINDSTAQYKKMES